MNVILENCGVPFQKRSDFGVISYTFDLEEVDLQTLQGDASMLDDLDEEETNLSYA
jgi:hypothetical protein